MNITLLESIKVEDGVIFHLEYHQLRVDRALKSLGAKSSHTLKEHITNPPQSGLFRCRIVYDENSLDVEYLPYIPKKIESLKAVYDDEIEYSLKYANRSALDKLFEKREDCDDVIIVKDGLISDTTIANIALFDGEKWFTPKKPLLYGTTRERLLKNRKIIEKNIKIDDIKRYSKYAIMNAMVSFYEIKSGIIL